MTILKVQRLIDADLSKLLDRGTTKTNVMQTVQSVFEAIKLRGLTAALEFTKQFDGVTFKFASELCVSDASIKEAYSKLSKEQISAIKDSITRVRAFCIAQLQNVQNTKLKTAEGITELRWLPIERVGIYAPAGRAPLPSSVIMGAITAKVAGVRKLILCAPPQKDGTINPAILVAANECGITEIYKIGGAQAIAAMTYGLSASNIEFPAVDMICGPGNAYVAYAKQYAASEGRVKIDTIAGPSEVLILADKTANPKLVAADMLAQAEHGPTSAAICVSCSESFSQSLAIELDRQLNAFGEGEKQEPMRTSLRNWGAILVAESLDQAIDFVNDFASEHVELYLENADKVANRITFAGAIFIGTGEVFGDYGMAGGNHILPTGRSARFASPVSVYSFLRQQQIEKMNTDAQAQLAEATADFARVETLEAHARSAEVRASESNIAKNNNNTKEEE
ncbi:histidinol dehydrogenase [Candidatus Micrarchaeota archaeon]|nr:histidinol dehydrogenase [Candidatus Micrarchaeota archaeon]